MRVLHLVDVGEDPVASRVECGGQGAACLCAAAIADATRDDHEVCLIGGSASERAAHRLGLTTTDRVAPPLGMAELAWPGVNALLRDRGFFDAVVCWSPASLRLAERTRAKRTPRLVVMPSGLGPLRSQLPRRAHSPVVVVADDGRRARAWASELGSIRPTMVAPLPVLPRTVEAPRERLRGKLRLRADHVAVALVGHCCVDVDALRFVHVVNLLAAAGLDVVGVIPRGAGRLARALRAATALPRPPRLIVSDATQLEQMAACDVAVWTGPPPEASDRHRFHFPESLGALGTQLGIPIVAACEAAPAAGKSALSPGDVVAGIEGHWSRDPVESVLLSPSSGGARRFQVRVVRARAATPTELAREVMMAMSMSRDGERTRKAAISTLGVMLGEAVMRAVRPPDVAAPPPLQEAHA